MSSRVVFRFTVVFIFVLLTPFFSLAQQQTKNFRSIGICTQNLQRLGSSKRSIDNKKGEKQLNYLVSRMKRANCDIIALQEVYGRNKSEAMLLLEKIGDELNIRSGKDFAVFLGESFDEEIRNGFLVAEDVGKVIEVKDFLKKDLPKLQPLGPAQHFGRGPLGLLIELASEVKQAASVPMPERLFVINIHFKSQSGSWNDASGLRFETVRMEMAAGIRDEVEKAAKQYGSKTALIVLGDKNSDYNSASSSILSGELELGNFTKNSLCSVDETLIPVCRFKKKNEADMISLFGIAKDKSPEPSKFGSYMYKKHYNLLDDIFVKKDFKSLFIRSDGTIAVGFKGTLNKGSDHLLLWAELGAANNTETK